MKRFIIPLILSFPAAGVAGNKGATETAEAFFTAIKAGDVDNLRNMIGAPLSGQIENLLINNAAYPEYLRTRYGGASAEVGEVTRFKKNEKQVDLVVTFPDGRVSVIKITISKRKSPQWKDTEQRKGKSLNSGCRSQPGPDRMAISLDTMPVWVSVRR